MTDKIFDDFMRDKLRNHASPVPQGLWEKIEKEKRRKPIGFFWSNRLSTIGAVVLLVAAFIAGYMLWQNNNSNQPTIASSTANNQTNELNATSSTQQKNIESNKAATTENNTFIAATQENTNANNSVAKLPAATINNTTIKEASTKISPNVGDKNTNANEFKNLPSKRSVTKKSMQLPTSVQQKKISNQQLSKENQQVFSADNFYLNTPSLLNRKELLVPIASNINMLNKQKLSTSNKLKFIGLNDCPSVNGNARNDWYVELYGSPDYTIKTTKSNTNNEAYLRKKDSTESMRVGYTLGGRISKNIGEHFMLKAGLQFSQINEHFTLRTENERRITTVITIKTVTDAFGNTTQVSDTSTLTQIGYLVKTSNNTYRNIELPVSLGYEFGNDKWKYSINGGVIVNMASWYKGTTLDTTYQAVNISSKANSDIYQRSIGLSLFGSFSIIKPITKKFSVYTEPYFRYSLSNSNSSSLGYNQRFSTIGLSLGIRYKFNNKRQH